MSGQNETLDVTVDQGPASTQQPPLRLVIAWCAADPSRVGEVAHIGGAHHPAELVVGRGPGDKHARWVRARPSGDQARPPLDDPRLSRHQLDLTVVDEDTLRVRNAGRRKLRIDGRLTPEGVVKPGALIEVTDSLLLWVGAGPTTLARIDEHPFGTPDADGIVGESAAAWQLRDQIRLLAPRQRHVLLVGESGTGKELVAQAIHAHSERAARPFVSRNAATFPEGLIDAELFGNVRNYPNPGMPERPGLAGEADGSTLFLDEIGELPEALQAHLLRLLDQGEYQRLGEARTRRADLRVVAATNRPADALKHDLAARLVLRIALPPLRERREDLGILLRHLLHRIASEDDALATRILDERGEPRVTVELVRALMLHELPTNVRQLERLAWQAILATAPESPLVLPDTDEPAAPPTEAPPRDPSEVTEAELREALERNDWVREQTWRALGLSDRYVLRRLMKKHGVKRPG